MFDDAPSRRERFMAALGLVEAAADLPGLKRAIDALRGPYGLSHAAFVAFGQPDQPGQPGRPSRPGPVTLHDTVLLTYPPDWIEHYFRRRYDRIDPVIQAASRSLVPVDWDGLDWSTPVATRFRGEGREVGVGPRGLVLPSRGPSDAQAMLVVCADMGERDWRPHSIDLMRDMSVIASHVHARILALQGDAAPGAGFRAAAAPVLPAAPAAPLAVDVAPLSGRERETLQWAATGKTIDQTAEILGLSSSAVRTYLDAARRKLKCLTKPQAVAVAMRRGLIEG